MKKLLMIILLAVLIAGCRRGDIAADLPVDIAASEKTKVITWLEKQKQKAGKDGAARITALQQQLDFAGLIRPAFGDDEYLYIIPIKAAFGSKNNAERNPVNHLVLFISSGTQAIRKGNIVQVIQPVPYSRQQLNKFFTDYYGAADHTFTGSLAYNTVADEMLYEINYSGGKYSYYKSIKKKQLAGGRTATCYEIGWYCFWADGSVTWEPVAEYCDGCEPVKTIHGKTYRVNCAGGGGVGAGGEEPSPGKLRTWLVYSENMYGPPIEIYAQIQMWGKKDTDYPQGGYFYKTSDQGSYTKNFSVYNAALENDYTQTWHGPQHAYQLFTGSINYHVVELPNKNVDETKVFQFAEVFP